VLSCSIVIFAANIAVGNDDFVRNALRKISYGNNNEITAWAYYAADYFRKMEPHQNKPCVIGLVATVDNGCLLIRELCSGVVLHNINRVDNSYGIHGIDVLEFSPNGEQLAVACNYLSNGKQIIFLDTKTGTKLPQEIFLQSCDIVLTMNYSPNGKKVCLFVQNKVVKDTYETSFQIYDISSKEPSRTNTEQKYIPFQFQKLQIKDDNIIVYRDKGKTETELYSSMLRQKIFERNAAFATPYPDKDFASVALQKSQQHNWTEKNLFNVTTIISPDNHKAATFYPNGVLHVWNVLTGKTSATFDFKMTYQQYNWSNDKGNYDYIQNFHFSHDGKFILIDTINTVKVYNVNQNRLIAVCRPTIVPAKPDFPADGLYCDMVVDSMLYDDKILMVETCHSIFVYQIDVPNKPIRVKLTKDYEFYSPTGRYVLFENDITKKDPRNNTQIEHYYELWDNKMHKKIILPNCDYGHIYECRFSQDEKFILFKKVEYEIGINWTRPSIKNLTFYRYDILQNKFEEMDELNKIGQIMILDSSEKRGIFYAMKPINDNDDQEITYEDEVIILNALSFDIIRREKFDVKKVVENLKVTEDFHGNKSKIQLNEYRSAIYIYDNNKKLKQVTLRFDIDDYLIIKSDSKVIGSHKGLKRYIHNSSYK
jgi:WD40 repeat protein